MSKKRTLSGPALLCLSLLLGACGAADPTGLAGGPLGDERRAPSEEEASWFRPSATELYCIVAPCPTYLLRGVNGAQSRSVAEVDLSALGLPPAAKQPQLGRLLLQGRFQERELNGRPYLIFEASRALEAVAPGGEEQPERDRYYAVQAGSACPDDSCLGFVARPLGGGEEESWGAVDLRPLQLSEADELAVMLQLRHGRMVLSRQPPTPADPRGAVVVTQAFRPLGL